MMKRKTSKFLTVVLLTSYFPVLLTSCGTKNLTHYKLTLPGEISSVDFGVKEYWAEGDKVYFTLPEGSVNVTEGEVNYELVKNFSSNDTRKIINLGSSTYITYSVYDKEYVYDNASFYTDYKLVNEDDSFEDGKYSKHLYSVSKEEQYYYINTFPVTRFIKDEDSFNEVCWSYDHDTTGYYMLSNDISSVCSKRSRDVTTQNTYHFLGTLDGNNHTIEQLTVNSGVLGIFGGNLAKKTIGGKEYSPTIKNLNISTITGENRLFGDSINDTTITNCRIYQGKYSQETNNEGLLARELGNNVKISSSTFSLGELVDNPCLFVVQNGTHTFTSCRITFSNQSSYLIKNDETTIAGSSISGITWLSDGIFSLKTYNGASLNLIGDEPEHYLSLVDDKTTKNDEIAEYLYRVQNRQNFGPVPVVINYSASNKVVAPITLTLAHDKEMTDVYKTYTDVSAQGSTYSLYNLIPGTYYYQLSDSSSTPNQSIVDSFTVKGSLRLIYADGISNMRDLGGWVNKDGQMVKYGLIYRSAGWSNLTTKGEATIKNELGIKTEMDLRFSTDDKDYSTSEHPISGVNFIHNGLTDGYPYMLTDSNTITDVKALVTYLTKPETYPIGYHCSAGADRTGYASLIVESILGFSDEDIYRDYELTTFYFTNRVRADILIDGDGNYYFREDGGRSDFWHESGFKQLLETNLKSYYTDTNLVCDAMVNFLKTKCSVTDDQLNAIRDIMLTK